MKRDFLGVIYWCLDISADMICVPFTTGKHRLAIKIFFLSLTVFVHVKAGKAVVIGRTCEME